MSLISKVQVTLNNISKKKAATIMKALEPDNVNFTKGLSLEIDNIDNKLVFNFHCNGDTKKMAKFLKIGSINL